MCKDQHSKMEADTSILFILFVLYELECLAKYDLNNIFHVVGLMRKKLVVLSIAAQLPILAVL